jgi:hypothetical protein
MAMCLRVVVPSAVARPSAARDCGDIRAATCPPRERSANVMLLDPKIKGFTWHVCQAIPARHEHLACTVRRT